MDASTSGVHHPHGVSITASHVSKQSIVSVSNIFYCFIQPCLVSGQWSEGIRICRKNIEDNSAILSLNKIQLLIQCSQISNYARRRYSARTSASLVALLPPRGP